MDANVVCSRGEVRMVLIRGARVMPISTMEEVMTIDFHSRDSSWDKSELVVRRSSEFFNNEMSLLSLSMSSSSGSASRSSTPSNLSASNSAS